MLDEILYRLKVRILDTSRRRGTLQDDVAESKEELDSDGECFDDEDIMFDHRSSLEQLDADLGLDADSVRSLPLAFIHERRKSPRLWSAAGKLDSIEEHDSSCK